ncbi:MAG: hypothetical protein ACKVI6_01160 [Candidatus Poseidoniales archaeon]|jgi:hypothetical protein|tara:strand:- start:249 stop:1205 length:957 start_codon:yes stop_codon:yes gene_type:complete
MASIFSEPKSYTIVFSTIIAALELINILGLMDNLALIINDWNIFPAMSIIEGKEKLIFIPDSLEIALIIFSNPPHTMWGELKLSRQDFIIITYLLIIMFRMWLNNPERKLRRLNARQKTRMIRIKSTAWFFISFILIMFMSLSIANKIGKIAKFYEKLGFSDFPEGAKLDLLASPRFVEPLPPLGLADFLGLFLLSCFIIFSFNKCFDIRLPIKTKSENLSTIERVWKDTDDAISIRSSKSNKAFPKVNDAFSNLIDLLSASATMNIAATALEDGDVKTSFDKWTLLTSPIGRDAEKWQGLSNSLSDIGNFNDSSEEE